MGLTKILMHSFFFKQLSLYIFKICVLDMQYLVEIISNASCFLDGFCTAVPVFIY